MTQATASIFKIPTKSPQPARGRLARQAKARAVWHENGQRQQCEAASEEKLAAKLAKVTERLEADAPNMTLRGADLIAFYLSRTASQSSGSGPVSTRISSAVCASGSPPRSSPRSDARRSRPGTCRRSSTPPPTPGEGERVRGTTVGVLDRARTATQ